MSWVNFPRLIGNMATYTLNGCNPAKTRPLTSYENGDQRMNEGRQEERKYYLLIGSLALSDH